MKQSETGLGDLAPGMESLGSQRARAELLRAVLLLLAALFSRCYLRSVMELEEVLVTAMISWCRRVLRSTLGSARASKEGPVMFAMDNAVIVCMHQMRINRAHANNMNRDLHVLSAG
jgi:hypothetical protein